MIQVQKSIAAKGLKQAEAAKVLHVSQPRVSDLLRGRPAARKSAPPQFRIAHTARVLREGAPYWILTTIAARRFRRRVSSRALSCFGRSSP